MNGVSKYRMYVLRFTYLLIATWLLFMIWPTLIVHDDKFALTNASVQYSLLAAVQMMAILGIRYPIKLLPLLLFEALWKTIWLLFVGLPLLLNNHANDWAIDTIIACSIGLVICAAAIPWSYVFSNYFKLSGDPIHSTKE